MEKPHLKETYAVSLEFYSLFLPIIEPKIYVVFCFRLRPTYETENQHSCSRWIQRLQAEEKKIVFDN